jgi:short subunit fatty acids transporter
MGIKERIIKFSIKKNLQKGVKGAGIAASAYASTVLAQFVGIELTQEQQIVLATFVAGALTSSINWAKVKFPEKLGWL